MYEDLIREIPRWLNNYLAQSSLRSFVVGVSGGIDSAVVSTLCACTGKSTFVVNIPINSSKENIELSDLHCYELEKRYQNVKKLHFNISPVYAAFLESVALDKKENSLSLANTKSRLRMTTLYYLAAEHQGIVVGTGNKIEDFGVGFFTKYGDGGVDISPIADLNKSEVRNLGRKLGVSENIINSRPTDGLWEDGRTDEDQLGASYEELEEAMELIESGAEIEELSHRKKEALDIYNHFHKMNSHKILSIPVFNTTKFR